MIVGGGLCLVSLLRTAITPVLLNEPRTLLRNALNCDGIIEVRSFAKRTATIKYPRRPNQVESKGVYKVYNVSSLK